GPDAAPRGPARPASIPRSSARPRWAPPLAPAWWTRSARLPRRHECGISEGHGGTAMPRYIKVAAAQMGPNQDGTPREAIVERMLGLLEQAIRDDVEIIVYPEMALTTYFPKRIRTDFDQFFETEVPPKALEPLLRRAAEKRVAVHVGFCEKADGKYFNTALLTDRDGRLAGVFRKIHLPGTKAIDGFAQVYEPYYFSHGDTGYQVFDSAGAKVGVAICQDR